MLFFSYEVLFLYHSKQKGKAMQTKLHIFNVLEVEGNEDFIKEIYADFKEQLSSQKGSFKHHINELPDNEDYANQNNIKQKQSAKKTTNKKGAMPNTPANYTYVQELWGGSLGLKLKELYNVYEDPKSHPKYVLLFLYILKQELKIEKVTLNHLYTCYRLANVKLPKHLRVAVNDAKKKAWLIDDWENLQVTPLGEDAVIHDFAQKKAA